MELVLPRKLTKQFAHDLKGPDRLAWDYILRPPLTEENAAKFASLSRDVKNLVALYVGRVQFQHATTKTGCSSIVRYLADLRKHLGATIVLLEQADHDIGRALGLARPQGFSLDWLKAQERLTVLALRRYRRLDRETSAPKTADIEILIESLATLFEQPVRKVGSKHELSPDFVDLLKKVWCVLPKSPSQMRPANQERLREIAQDAARKIFAGMQTPVGMSAEEAHDAAQQLLVKYLIPRSRKSIN